VQNDGTWDEFVAAHPLDSELEVRLALADQIMDRLEELERGLVELCNAVFDHQNGVLLDPEVFPVEGWDDQNEGYTG
jgi:hypothetical protein